MPSTGGDGLRPILRVQKLTLSCVQHHLHDVQHLFCRLRVKPTDNMNWEANSRRCVMLSQ